MTLIEIKQAIEAGKSVKWSNDAYDVIKNNKGEYLIVCNINNHCIGLTHRDNLTMNGQSQDFYIN